MGWPFTATSRNGLLLTSSNGSSTDGPPAMEGRGPKPKGFAKTPAGSGASKRASSRVSFTSAVESPALRRIANGSLMPLTTRQSCMWIVSVPSPAAYTIRAGRQVSVSSMSVTGVPPCGWTRSFTRPLARSTPMRSTFPGILPGTMCM